ncbi:MAG TPA: GNAT family N-acetyltransferase [Acidimicrobiales bacterium]|nr:GNAT family N-acetyltransferase [Acidimicrobiales bacterium]
MAEDLTIARCESASDFEAFFTVYNRTLPLHAVDRGYVGAAARGVLGGKRFLARAGDAVVGVASSDTYPGGALAAVVVLPERRGRGIGCALWQRIADELPPETVSLDVDYDDERSVRLAERCGFVRPSGEHAVSFFVDVADAAETQPEGVRVLSVDELANPVFLDEFVAVASIANETFPDDPALDPHWVVETETSRYDHGGVTLVHEEDGELIGICQAVKSFAVPQLYSEYTLVRKDRRGGGVATRLKRAQLAWAKANGIERIVTDIPDSEPMRRVLLGLGYRRWERGGMTREGRADS